MRTLVFFFGLLLAVLAPLHAQPFDLHRDTFAFSNDTVFAYGVDEAGQLHISKREKPAEFSHGCFLLSRGVLQFHRFARFAPGQKRLSREEYRVLLRRLFCTHAWLPPRPAAQRLVFPGYANLHEFSRAYEGLLKENLGAWFPTYLRVGNWRMMMGHPRAGQAALAKWLDRSLAQGEPRALFLTRFPHMNHVVIAYTAQKQRDGRTRYLVYDPNYPNQPSWLEYVPAERSFNFEKRWYFPGGRINVLRTYISPVH